MLVASFKTSRHGSFTLVHSRMNTKKKIHYDINCQANRVACNTIVPVPNLHIETKSIMNSFHVLQQLMPYLLVGLALSGATSGQ